MIIQVRLPIKATIVNNEKLAGLKFGKSINQFGKSINQFGEFIQNYEYAWILELLQLANKVWRK